MFTIHVLGALCSVDAINDCDAVIYFLAEHDLLNVVPNIVMLVKINHAVKAGVKNELVLHIS